MFGFFWGGNGSEVKQMARVSREPVPEASETGIIDLRPQVDDLIRHKYHRRAVSPTGIRGMSERAYRALWPVTVRIPREHDGRYEKAMLVDPTIGLDGLAALPIGMRFDSAHYRDVVPIPGGAARHIRFVTFGETSTAFLSPRAAERSFRPGQAGLTGWDGFHLFAQFRFLREFRFAVDRCEFPALSIALCGSRCGATDVPALIRTNYGVSLGTRGMDFCGNVPGGQKPLQMEWTASGSTDVIPID